MTLLIILELFISLSWGADFRTRFSCATDHPTTSYALIESADNYELQIMHHNGTEFMPIFGGLITGYDLTLLKEKAELFKQMGNRQVVYFSKAECTTSNEEWTCLKKQEVTLGQLKSKNFKFSLTDKRVVTSNYDILYKVAQISLVVGSYGHSIPMEYEKNSCTFYP